MLQRIERLEENSSKHNRRISSLESWKRTADTRMDLEPLVSAYFFKIWLFDTWSIFIRIV